MHNDPHSPEHYKRNGYLDPTLGATNPPPPDTFDSDWKKVLPILVEKSRTQGIKCQGDLRTHVSFSFSDGTRYTLSSYATVFLFAEMLRNRSFPAEQFIKIDPQIADKSLDSIAL